MLFIVPGNHIIFDVIDLEDDNYNAMQPYTHAITLPTQIFVKPNFLVEIFARNYNTQDDLVNGLNEIFKACIKQDNFDIVWI